MTPEAAIAAARRSFHEELLQNVLRADKGVPNNADKDNANSVKLATAILRQIPGKAQKGKLQGQQTGSRFETACENFVKATLPLLNHLRPGKWHAEKVSSRSKIAIARFDQFSHLDALAQAAKQSRELAAILGSDYVITPDLIVYRSPEEDATINAKRLLVDSEIARYTPLRSINDSPPTLHASISCKWTIRSDRVQNIRSEALNLVRNRKGRLPHIVSVVAEPLPSRIESIALGTGDIDCVYHFALPELQEAVAGLGLAEVSESLDTMVAGHRLRDIGDLPLDLVI